jgi:hypothetical protein
MSFPRDHRIEASWPKLQMEPEKVYEMVVASVTRARSYTDDVEWSCEDGTRTEHDFLCRCVEAAIKAGATTINIPDTVGYTVPEEYFSLFQMVRERVPKFAHESGIHQDGMLKHTQTYEIMTPDSVGVKQTSLVMGKHSGRHAFVHKLEELGYVLTGNQLEDAFVRFKALADRKKHVYDEDIEALVDEEIAHAQDRVKLVSLTVIAGTMGPQSATLTLDIDGQHQTVQSTGNGPVDATFNAIKALMPHEAVLELYQVHAVTEGTDAQAEVSVRLSENGRAVTAKGADPDTLVASAKAYLGALNKLMVKRQRGVVAARRIHSTDAI